MDHINYFAKIKNGQQKLSVFKSVSVSEGNSYVLELAQNHYVNYVFIDDKCEIDIDL